MPTADRRTACRHGHPFAAENIAIGRGGQRLCLTCRSNRAATFEARFLARVLKTDTCWLWQGNKSDDGYGHVKLGLEAESGRRTEQAHRWAYERWIGPIPEGLQLDHLCRTPPCVNPAHLEAVTSGENTRRHTRLITECPAGHPYDKANTYVGHKGKRACRACARLRDAARRPRGQVTRSA